MSAPACQPLAVTDAARRSQREWFQGFRRRVLEQNEPYVIASAVAPHEIFHAMDVPVVPVPWYSSVIAAKQLSDHYFSLMGELGYHAGLPRYDTLPFFTTLDDDPERAPYGGLPKPAMIVERLRGDYAQRVAEQWADAYGCPVFLLDSPALTRLRPGWYARGQRHWEELYETHRLDFQVGQLEQLIRASETATGKHLSHGRLTEQMRRINELGELVAETRDILARTSPTPVPLTEQLVNVMACTWRRGSQWAVDHARAYRDEVRGRADAGMGFCPNERVRLLWLNNGLWFNTGFYRYFEEAYGAVFVWSMYTNFLSDGYRKYFEDDPLRALAARHISMNEQLHLPPWMAEWILKQAEDFGADGAVMLTPLNDRMSALGNRFAKLALEAAGLPVLEIRASAVDAGLWRDDENRTLVGQFIEERILRSRSRLP